MKSVERMREHADLSVSLWQEGGDPELLQKSFLFIFCILYFVFLYKTKQKKPC